jgi:DNA-binding CsgD family transcriptional regulator
MRHHLIGPAGKLEAVTERQWKCFQLRAGGYSFRKIAAELDISYETARQDCKTVVGELKEATADLANSYRYAELQRLGELLVKWVPMAQDGDPKAAEVVIRLTSLEADLVGSRAPVAIAAEVVEARPAEEPDLSKLSIEELYAYRTLIMKTLGMDQPVLDVVPFHSPGGSLTPSEGPAVSGSAVKEEEEQ